MSKKENAGQNQSEKEQNEEPKSAHASPAVEKYVEKRKNKAERQIANEDTPDEKQI